MLNFVAVLLFSNIYSYISTDIAHFMGSKVLEKPQLKKMFQKNNTENQKDTCTAQGTSKVIVRKVKCRDGIRKI